MAEKVEVENDLVAPEEPEAPELSAAIKDATKSNRSTASKTHRVSLTTRLISNLQREKQVRKSDTYTPGKSSWMVGMLFLHEDGGAEKIRDLIVGRLMEIPRFKSYLHVSMFGSLSFRELEDDELDLEYHFQEQFKDKPASLEELDTFVGSMFDDFKHPKQYPLWQLHYCHLDDGRVCLITNISHAIGDGISMIEVLLRLLDKPSEEDEEAMKRMKTMKSPGKRKPPSLGPLTKTKVFLGGVADGVLKVFSPPDKTNTLRLKDPNKPSPTKRCCFSDSIDLPKVKQLKNMYEGATLNDILVTLMTLTLKSYFEEVDDKVALKNRVRAQFPINLRTRKQGAFRTNKNGVEDARNNFAYGFLDFHVRHKGDQSQLMWKTKRTLDKIKSSPAPYVQQRVARTLLPVLPLSIMNSTLLNLAAKATCQLSNVPGPQVEARIGGVTLDDMQFLLFSPLSFYAGLLTYNGKLSASFCIDSALADPKLLAKHWVPQFEAWFEFASQQASQYDDGVIPRPSSCLDCL